MPSPAIPRSKSAPDITSPHSPSNTDIPPSNKSVRSAHSTGSPITAWGKKLGSYITTTKTKNPNLTEETLQEFNRRNALETKNNTSSPYYKGLIDYTLGINREKLSGSSPGRESRATSFVSSSSKTSFVGKVQEWGSSCFTSKTHEKSISSSSSLLTQNFQDTKKNNSSSSALRTPESEAEVTKTRTKTRRKDTETERKKVTFPSVKIEDAAISTTEEKPLRERDSETSAMLPLPPPTAPPPESLPYPQPQVTAPTANSLPSPPQTPILNAQTPLPQESPLSPPPTMEAPAREFFLNLPLAVHALAQESVPSPPPTAQVPPQELVPSPPPTAHGPPEASVPSEPPAAQEPPQESVISPPPAARAPPPPRTPAAGFVYENRETNTAENEMKYIWADKYRPFWLREFLCNETTALSLQRIVRTWDDKVGECGHFIFEGNPGVGKRTMIWALLREAFGPDKVQAREECKEFYLKGEAVGSILVNLMVSQQHIEVNLSELKGYEKHVIVELIKEKNENFSSTTLHSRQENCKAIILYEADRLSTDALSYIKWMLEKFKGHNKIFFCCSDASKLQAIKPLCTYVELLEPSNEEILKVLAFIAEKEGIQLSQKLADKIAKTSKNNLRQAIRSFEATWHFNGSRASLGEDLDIKSGWEDKIANIARNVLEEQSPKQLYIIRGELQNLIEHNVAPEFIFQTINEELKKILPEQLQLQFDNLHEEYQKNHAIKRYLASTHQQEIVGKRQNDQRKNVQQFMRIEEFIARFMSWYKGLLIQNKEVEQMQSREDT